MSFKFELSRRDFPAVALALVPLILSACVTEKPAQTVTEKSAQTATAQAGQADTALARQVVAAPDRSERDRAADTHRKPIETLAFFGLAPGMRVADLGAGGGYSSELFARAVGPGGAVFAQDTPDWAGPGLTMAWETRLAKPALKNTTHFMRHWDDPLPPEAKNLDAVYSVAIYHDVLVEKFDVNKLNAAVFAALKPGGIYAIIDNSAKAGSGAAEVERLHRIDEALVREQVEKAGFKLVGEASFLRNPADTRDWNADPETAEKENPAKAHIQDRFALKFTKP